MSEASADARTIVTGAQALSLVPLALLGLDALGVAWSPAVAWTVLGPAVLVAFATNAPSAGRWRRLEPGDLLALAALVVFAGASLLEWNVHTDFVFHWGTKAERFFLARGLDVEFLARPWNEHVHPDYPNGLPVMIAALAIASGAFRWTPVALLSTLHLALLLLATRELLARARAGAVARTVALGTVAWGVLAFGVGFRQAGGADLPLAFAVTAGVAALLASPGGGVAKADARSTDREVAWIAAFAALTKVESMAFAALLLAAHAARRVFAADDSLRRRGRILFETALRTAGPTLLAVALWAWTVVRHDLFLASNTGGFDLAGLAGKIAVVVSALARSLATPEWLGLPLVLLALPLVLFDRRLRVAAALLLAQGGFYLYAYLAGPVDVEYWVVSSSARLALHLVPASLVLVFVALDRPRRGEQKP